MTQKTSDVTTPQSGAVELFRQQFERWRRGLVRDLADIDDALTALESGSGDAQLLVRRAGVDIGTRPAINLHEGTGITIVTTDDNVNDEVDITINSTITTYTDEMAQDAVGAAGTDTATINFTYNDGANTMTWDVIQAALDHGTIGGLGDDDHTQYLRTDGTRAGTGSQAWSSASPTITIGDGSGSPGLRLDKSDAGGLAIQFRNNEAGTMRTRWDLRVFGNEDLGLERYDSAEVFQGGLFYQVNGSLRWQDTGIIYPNTDNANDLGSASNRWRALYTQDVQVSGASIVTPSYVTLATTAALPNERVLTEGHGIDLVDAGAGSTITVDVDETELDASLIPAGYPTASINRVLYEVNFSTLATNDLASATESIDGLTWNTNNVSALGTHQVLNGTGIQLSVGTSITTHVTFNTTTRDTYYLDIPLGSLPGWDPRYETHFEIYFPTLTLEGNGDTFFIGLYGLTANPGAGSAIRLVSARINNVSGTLQLGGTNAATSTNVVNRSGENVMGIRVGPNGIGCGLFGTWSSGWPAALNSYITYPAIASVSSPFNHSDVRLCIGLGGILDASPTSTVSIERMRVLRIG